MLNVVGVFSFILLGNIYANSFVLNETSLIEETKKESASSERIKASFLEAKKTRLKVENSLGYKLYGGYNYNKTNEKGVAPFAPVFTPVHQYQLGLSKNFKYGISSKLEATVDSRSTSSISSANTTSLGLELGFDLWENFLGRITKREVENANLGQKQLALKEEIDRVVFVNSTRKLYWSLVANSEKFKLTKKLLGIAKKQLKQARNRKKQAVADTSEVARYASQVSLREGQVLLLKYEKENILKSLRSLVPSLKEKSVVLGSYNVNRSIYEVLACTQKIGTFYKTPYKYTSYDEITKFLTQIQKNQEAIDNSNGATISLRTKFKRTGVSSNDNGNGTFSGSFEDSVDEVEQRGDGFEAGLQFNIPLGEASSELNEVNKIVNKKRLKAQILEVDSNISATHKQISNSIKILSDVMKTQKENSRYLKIRVKDMRKKYRQARIPLYALMQDEDSLMDSDLAVIDTQLTIVNTLLDYFIVFTETPCTFNRK